MTLRKLKTKQSKGSYTHDKFMKTTGMDSSTNLKHKVLISINGHC